MADGDETTGGGEAGGGGGPTPQLEPCQLLYLIFQLQQIGLSWKAIYARLAAEYGDNRVITFMRLAGLRHTREESEPLPDEKFVRAVNEASRWQVPNLFKVACYLRDCRYSRSQIVAALKDFWDVDEIEAECDKANVTQDPDKHSAVSGVTILVALGMPDPEPVPDDPADEAVPDQSGDNDFEI